jgi:hypothetical protein
MTSGDRIDVPEATRRELIRRAGEQCAICRRAVRAYPEEPGKRRYIAEAAHIIAVKPGGERGTTEPRPPDINGISNLIALCRNCHGIIYDRDGRRGAEELTAFLGRLSRRLELSHPPGIGDLRDYARRTGQGPRGI